MNEAVDGMELLGERTAEIRHNARNRLAAIRNATYYLRRQAEKSPSWETNPKLEKFYELICSELEQVDQLITTQITAESLLDKREEVDQSSE